MTASWHVCKVTYSIDCVKLNFIRKLNKICIDVWKNNNTNDKMIKTLLKLKLKILAKAIIMI